MILTWVHLLELDPRLGRDNTRPQSGEDLKEVQIGSKAHHKIKMGRSLDAGTKEQLVWVLKESWEPFACSQEKRRVIKEENVHLNKACPIYPYSQSSIDTLVDRASRCEL
ncbi:hypothetical protein CR513_19385, partial [Mucuna pruriens]